MCSQTAADKGVICIEMSSECVFFCPTVVSFCLFVFIASKAQLFALKQWHMGMIIYYFQYLFKSQKQRVKSIKID